VPADRDFGDKSSFRAVACRDPSSPGNRKVPPDHDRKLHLHEPAFRRLLDAVMALNEYANASHKSSA
jgi:hypothetical protein